MKHKIFRALLSLVLVCVLLISWSPIRARATSAGATAGIITQVLPLAGEGGAVAGGATLGTAAFGYILGGLGVFVGGVVLLTLVDRYQEYTGETDFSIYYNPGGSWSYGVDMSFVERVRHFLFDEGYVISNPNFVFSNSQTVMCGGTEYVLTSDYPFAVVGLFYNTGNRYSQTQFFAFSTDKIAFTANGSSKGMTDYGYYSAGSFFLNNLDDCRPNSTCPIVEIPSLTNAEISAFFANEIPSGLVTTIDGAELGVVAPLDVAISEGYSEWYTNSQSVNDPDSADQITLFPIPLNPSADPEEQLGTLTQTDIWQGSISDPLQGVTPDAIGLAEIWEIIKGIPSALADVITGPIVGTLTDIWDFIKTIPGTLADVITGPIVGALTNIWDLITSSPQAIAEAISAIFVPEADFITEKWNAIRSRFAFADSIASSGEMILGVLQGIDPEPPVIYVELGDAEGSYYLGGQVAFLDLRWYARYKPTGDAIISAFLWLVFVWRMFIKLPGIIAGLPGDFVMQGVIDLGLADRLPARKKEFENQRQENRRFFKK